MSTQTLNKPMFTVDQMMSSTDAGRRFSELRKRAVKTPQFITDHNAVETVVMSYEYYEKIYTQLETYKESEIDLMAEARLLEGESDKTRKSIPLKTAMTKEEYEMYQNLNADDIADEDLFE